MPKTLYPSLTQDHLSFLEPVLCKVSVEIPKKVKQEIIKITEEFLSYKKSQFEDWSDSVLNSLDFHYSNDELKIIEANTNASGYLVSNLLLENESKALGYERDILNSFYKVFETDKPEPLYIMDEDPESEKMFSEFLMFKDMFLRNDNSKVKIIKTKDLPLDENAYVYNRDTDFYFEKNPEIFESYKNENLKLSTSPVSYERLASKKNDLRSTSTKDFPNLDKALLKSVPFSKDLWPSRKKYFFKPQEMFGGKGVYAGKSLSRKKFETLDDSYLAQESHLPGKITHLEQEWKYDIRAFFSESSVQKIIARVYQGQLTNFSTAGGGFALIKWL